MSRGTDAAPKGGQALAVRLVRREERARWRELMREHHYLGFEGIIGKSLDPRRPRGVRHSVVTVAAIGVCAALSGACSFVVIAEWAQGLSREGLRRLGSKRWKPP